jgi:hypothetical protein
MFSVPDAPEVVARFYGQEMVSLGWELQSETKVDAAVVQLWNKQDRTVTITMSANDSITYVVVTPL